MNKVPAFMIAALFALFLVALWLLRYAVLAVLLFLRPVVNLVFGFAAMGSLVALVLAVMIMGVHPDHPQMMWGFFVAGLVSTVILFCYDAIVLSLAPGRFPMLLAR